MRILREQLREIVEKFRALTFRAVRAATLGILHIPTARTLIQPFLIFSI